MDRRDILRQIGTGIGFSLTGGAAVASAGDGDGSIRGTSVTSATVTERNVSTDATLTDDTAPLASHLQGEKELSLQKADAFGIDTVTNNPDLNRLNPTAVVLPFTGGVESSAGGLMNVLLVDHEGERVPAARFAVSATPSNGAFKMDYIGIEDGEAVTMLTGRRQLPDNVSTHADISCYTCKAIVGGICGKLANGGSLSIPLCSKVCAPLVTTIGGAIVCGAVCVPIVEAIAAVGCVGAADQVCDRTPFC
jgi:halocin C8-like bacteriocin domain-containing protein